MKVRLKTNLIADGKFYARDSIVDDAIVPEHLRNEVAAYDLEDRDGKVLVLRDLTFQSIPKAGSDGIHTSYPVHAAAGEVLDLNQVPALHRKQLKEGTDYATKWTNDERAQLQKAAQEVYLKHFESEPAPAGARGAL